MADEVMSQWVVRLPDRLVLLKRPLTAIRVFSTDEVLQFKARYSDAEVKTRIERQQDTNERQNDVTFAYWVVLFPLGLPLDVLCCTVQRATADRILDSLAVAMFSNCGDNTAVDLRELLAADLVTPEQVTAAAAPGRFVDLGDGEGQSSRRTAATVGSVGSADIPIEIIPVRGMSNQRRVGEASSAALDGMIGRLWTPGEIPGGVRSAIMEQPVPSRDAQLADFVSQPVPGQAVSTAVQWRREPVIPAPLLDYSTVQNIGRGMNRNSDEIMLAPQDRDRIEAQLNAALLRQQPENRNTRAASMPPQPNGNAEALAARDIRRRPDPLFDTGE